MQLLPGLQRIKTCQLHLNMYENGSSLLGPETEYPKVSVSLKIISNICKRKCSKLNTFLKILGNVTCASCSDYHN